MAKLPKPNPDAASFRLRASSSCLRRSCLANSPSMSISQMGLLVFSKNEGGFFFSGGFAAVRSRSPPAEEDRDGEGDPSDAARAGDRRPTRERARASARTRRAVGASAGGASVDIAAARRGVAAREGRRSFVGKTASVSIRNHTRRRLGVARVSTIGFNQTGTFVARTPPRARRRYPNPSDGRIDARHPRFRGARHPRVPPRRETQPPRAPPRERV